MSKSKEVIMASSNSELENIVSKEIRLSKQEVDPFVIVLPGTISVIVLTAGVAGGIATGDITNVLMAGVATGFMAATAGMSFLCDKLSKINRTFFPDGNTELTTKDRRKAKTERVLVNTIHIRDQVDVYLTEWQDPKNSVPEHEATHTVKQYLRKTGKGYQVEQEISPNNESIWDISADALVEVYGVQENKDSMKEVTA